MFDSHGDLFRSHDSGFATLAIRDGNIRFDSAVDAPFGRAVDPDHSQFTPVSEWMAQSDAESSSS